MVVVTTSNCRFGRHRVLPGCNRDEVDIYKVAGRHTSVRESERTPGASASGERGTKATHSSRGGQMRAGDESQGGARQGSPRRTKPVRLERSGPRQTWGVSRSRGGGGRRVCQGTLESYGRGDLPTSTWRSPADPGSSSSAATRRQTTLLRLLAVSSRATTGEVIRVTDCVGLLRAQHETIVPHAPVSRHASQPPTPRNPRAQIIGAFRSPAT